MDPGWRGQLYWLVWWRFGPTYLGHGGDCTDGVNIGGSITFYRPTDILSGRGEVHKKVLLPRLGGGEVCEEERRVHKGGATLHRCAADIRRPTMSHMNLEVSIIILFQLNMGLVV